VSAGVTSLAIGADQLFAGEVLKLGAKLVAIVPAEDYDSTFSQVRSLAAYQRLLDAASDVVTLPVNRSTEQAFFAAGREVVQRSDVLLAVWDGNPPQGSGAPRTSSVTLGALGARPSLSGHLEQGTTSSWREARTLPRTVRWRRSAPLR
jgi:hypothetical protein